MTTSQMSGVSRRIVAVLAILLVIAPASVAYAMKCQLVTLNTEYTKYMLTHGHSDTEYASLTSDYMSLSTEYISLFENYGQLNVTYRDLAANYTFLQNQFTDLTTTYSDLSKQYSVLTTNYADLEQSIIQLEADYYALVSSYGLLYEEYVTYQQNYDTLRENVNLHTISLSSELITPDAQEIKDKVQEITGGWSNSSDWYEYWEDIKELYDWVHDNIEYRYDGLYPLLPSNPSSSFTQYENMYQFPAQTLSLGKGDCDDKAILLCSMIRSYTNKQYLAECMMVKSHLLCYIPVTGDKICILDPTMGYYTNTGGPSYSITQKEVDSETNNYLSWSETQQVYSVFSDYLQPTNFSNTQAFVDWIKDRV